MQDRPDARELIEAVAHFVEREILPTLADPRLRFRGLVAANVLAVAARELAAGSAPLYDEWRRLSRLHGQSDPEPPPTDDDGLRRGLLALNRELCLRIRAGEADEGAWHDQVFAHVEATVIGKLEIANPRYLERVMKD
jgi:hypothetical protein